MLFLTVTAIFVTLVLSVSTSVIPPRVKLPSEDAQPLAVATPLRSDIDRLKSEATAYFKNDPQGIAIEAIWTSLRELTIGVNRDNRNFDDYAANACRILIERGLGSIENLRVDIVDLVEVRENGNWRPIGRADCNRASLPLTPVRAIY